MHPTTLTRGMAGVSEVARAEFIAATDGLRGDALGRALVGLLFVLACLPCENLALPAAKGDA